MRRLRFLVPIMALALTGMPGIAEAHELDHPAPALTEDAPLSTTFNSGGRNADWELITTVPTGNPHTDLDFFTRGGNTYASFGTLAAGPNGAGQSIVRLTQDGKVTPETVELISNHPSAECPSNPASILGLQHDVEATPKGRVLSNSPIPAADRRPTQLLLDATDAEGRCHDNGEAGVGAPLGGIEIIDVTNLNDPVEIGLTSHIGEAHTVNVDPRRPHIVYVVSSDAVTVNNNGTPNNLNDDYRENRIEGDNDAADLDGFEVMDISSCMDFPKGTSVAEKRQQCRPKVFRYRYPNMKMALGHTLRNSVYGCHELEIYPNDKLTCGGGNAMIYLNINRMFNDRGTPNNYRDDRLRGDPLPCRRRDTTSLFAFMTGAKVTDCVVGREDVDLTIPNWLKIGSPSLAGIRHIGSAHHTGRAATGQLAPYDSTEDIDFNHESELTHSRKFVIATDERGGGVAPPGATCDTANANRFGNGGLHAYAVKRLDKRYPESAKEAWQAYARTPKGKKAIHRVQIHTEPQAAVCTAHVFQQIPGQNRIFMGWYSQGTQVIDYIELPGGKFRFVQAGYFIPEHANEWVSHIFKMRKNRNGTFTYWGAAGDFALADAGRNTIDVYKVTMPRPPLPPSVACQKRNAITGGKRSDILVGTKRADIICGRGGNDLIRARGGADIVIGNAGNDTMRLGGGADDAYGGSGSDTMSGTGGKDKIRGGAGADSIDGNGSNDVAIGGGGRDSVRGNNGYDTLKGSGGNDTVQGGTGNDIVRGSSGDDVLKGFSGEDLLDGGPGRDTCEGGSGNDRRRHCER
ncbi:MAG: calcium-binding protein [Actinomycetota bacterium]|nr:calcium-binding protein [Actinomycetota bacterium]